MVPEVCELREALVAEVAGEGLLAGVDEGVALQLGRRREVLAAVVARVHASPLPVAVSLDCGQCRAVADELLD